MAPADDGTSGPSASRRATRPSASSIERVPVRSSRAEASVHCPRCTCWSHSPGTSQRSRASYLGDPRAAVQGRGRPRAHAGLDQQVDRPHPARTAVPARRSARPAAESPCAQCRGDRGLSTGRQRRRWRTHSRPGSLRGPHSGRAMTINLHDDAFDRGRLDVREAAHRLRTARDKSDQRVTGLVPPDGRASRPTPSSPPGTTGASPRPTSGPDWSRWPS